MPRVGKIFPTTRLGLPSTSISLHPTTSLETPLPPRHTATALLRRPSADFSAFGFYGQHRILYRHHPSSSIQVVALPSTSASSPCTPQRDGKLTTILRQQLSAPLNAHNAAPLNHLASSPILQCHLSLSSLRCNSHSLLMNAPDSKVCHSRLQPPRAHLPPCRTSALQITYIGYTKTIQWKQAVTAICPNRVQKRCATATSFVFFSGV